MDDSKEKEQERIAYWLGLAQYDLETAQTLLKGGRYLYVGFMCHQVIEKTLKAHFFKNRKTTPPYNHNLGYFAKEVGLLDIFTEDQKKLIAQLQPLNVESRYPTYKDKIYQTLNEERCARLILQTEELYKWLRDRL